jgi:hypothetical protein
VYAITAIVPTTTTELVVDELLYCVLGKCRPCKPSDWTQFVGPLGTPRTCGGYDAALSTRLGRYATSTSMPAFTYTCSSLSGDLVVTNSTVDYNYAYPLGDRSLWTPPPTTTTATAVTATATRTGGGQTSSNANSSAAARVYMATAVVVAAALVCSL